jgi:transcription antitermination factor NusG
MPRTPTIREDMTWFALRCGYRAELEVEETLREQFGFDAYCPTETKWHRERRIRRIVRWPLLTGYVFTGLERTQHGPAGLEFPFEPVEAIEGVVDFVRSSGRPAPFRYTPATPSPRAEALRLKAWWERKAADHVGEMPDEPPGPPLSISEIREMEAAGAFDFTQDRIVAEKASKLARRSFQSFAELVHALNEEAA